MSLTSSTPPALVGVVLKKSSLVLSFFFQSNNPIILGPDNSNLPKIFLIIADGVANESIKSEDVCSKRLANVIRQVTVSCWCQQLDFQEAPSAGSNSLFLLRVPEYRCLKTFFKEAHLTLGPAS